MKTWEFTRARTYVRKLGLRTASNYYAWATGELAELPAKPHGIPSNPHQAYPAEWAGFGDWLDSENIATFQREWAPFEYAREFARSLELSSGKEWSRYASGKIPALGTRPLWLPSNPNLAYRDEGWAGIKDWLGTGDKRGPKGSRMRPFEAAREFARRLGLRSWVEWRAYVNGARPALPPKPADVPAVPHACYKTKGWISYADFLGGENQAWHQVEWRKFLLARDFARSLNLYSMLAWRAWAQTGDRPKDIPANPDKAYAGVWLSWRDWFGRKPQNRLRLCKTQRFPPIEHSSRVRRANKVAP